MLVDGNGETVLTQPALLSSSMSDKSDLVVAAIQDQDWVAVWTDANQAGGENSAEEILMENLPLSASTQLANPASVNCIEQGCTSEIRTDDSGGKYGECIFEDGSECDEWALFQGECKPGE